MLLSHGKKDEGQFVASRSYPMTQYAEKLPLGIPPHPFNPPHPPSASCPPCSSWCSTMRLPYAPSNPPSPSSAAAYTQISARRAPQPFQALDLTLLHSPPVASGWSSFLGAIRTQTSLPACIRELCICRVAALNGAEYEWMHHIGILRSEGGLGEIGEKEVRSGMKYSGGELDERQWAVMAYTDAMTRDVKVGEEIFERLGKWFSEKEVVEITATVAAYNCVSRFLVALDVGEMNEKVKEREDGVRKEEKQ